MPKRTTSPRYASLYAGLPYETSATFIEMQCGSAINAINHAAYQIRAGDADAVIVGGCESYSRRCAKFSMPQEPYCLVPPTAIKNRLAPAEEDDISMIDSADMLAPNGEYPGRNVTPLRCGVKSLLLPLRKADLQATILHKFL